MAEMNTSDSGGKKKHGGGKRSKKMSTRVDMTPMVDLGFLLITFFMLTTTFAKPQAMELNMPVKPENEEEQPPVKQSKVLNLILSDHDKIISYWIDPDMSMDANIDSIDFTISKNIRPIIKQRAAEVRQKFNKEDEMIILIKPKEKSNYKNMVDILDEMSITNSKRYAIVDFSAEDSIVIATGKAVVAPSL